MPTSHPKSKKRPQASEMFSIRHGKRVDDHIHQPILDNPEADKTILSTYGQRLRQQGFSEESIKRLTSPEDPESTPPAGGFAAGGASNLWSFSAAKHPRHPAGMIKSSIPGRTDKIPLSLRSGSYVVPADTLSALGQNNSDAGAKILTKMLKMGPYGSGETGALKTAHPHMPRFDWMRTPRPTPRHFAEGGAPNDSDDVDIIAAGGEFLIPPDVVKEVGHGDLNAGHRVLDALVLRIRKEHIKTLRSLKPPKG